MTLRSATPCATAWGASPPASRSSRRATPTAAPPARRRTRSASLSLDPPLLLVCLARTSLTLAALRGHGHFAVNVLAPATARPRARSRARGSARTPGRPSSTGPDTPAARASTARSPCSTARSSSELPGGDHVIVVGRVLDVETRAGQATRPLVVPPRRVRGAAGAARRARRWPTATCRRCTARFRAVAEATSATGGHVVALVHGDPEARARRRSCDAHTACLFGDAPRLAAVRRAGRASTPRSRAIVAAGAGVLLYAKPAAPPLALCAGQPPLDDAVADTLLRRVLARVRLTRLVQRRRRELQVRGRVAGVRRDAASAAGPAAPARRSSSSMNSRLASLDWP